MNNFFTTGPSPETLIDRLAVIWDSAEREFNADMQRFEAQSRSELARESYKKYREEEIAFRTRRNIVHTVSPEVLRLILRDIDKTDRPRIGILNKTLNFLEPQPEPAN